MLHPDIVVKSSSLGSKGLFTKKKIPMGTIIWRWEKEKERIYTTDQFSKFSKRYRNMILKFGHEFDGKSINYSIDNSKYWNHSCEPNTASLKSFFYMDIAIRDIDYAEELTFDYCTIMSPKWPTVFKCCCGSVKCRGIIPTIYKPEMINKLFLLAKNAKKHSKEVNQPLLSNNKIKI